MADPVVMHIQPVDDDLVYYLVFIGDRQLFLAPTATPYIDTAIELLYQGYDPERRLLMRRRGVDVNQLSYEIGDAAGLEVENQANPPFLYPLQQDGPGAVP